MEKICKNCEYYIISNNFADYISGRCFNINLQDDTSNDVENYLSKKEIYKSNKIYATCDEERGELFVGQNFGCIHFDER